MTFRLPAESRGVTRVVGDPNTASGPLVFTCEHASNSVPGLTTNSSDTDLLQQHWGWDIGAAAVVEVLCHRMDSVAVLADVSRLVIDVNRAPDSSTLVVQHCGDTPVHFNENVDSDEVSYRTRVIYNPYHASIESVMASSLEHRMVNLVSIHSFTPVWNGTLRPMEIGVLYDRHETDAFRLKTALEEEGFKTALNAPYSGLTGELMYSATRHGAKYRRPYLELEIRQDLIGTPEKVHTVGGKIARALSVFRP